MTLTTQTVNTVSLMEQGTSQAPFAILSTSSSTFIIALPTK
jgi:hypothetical protein